MNHASDRLGAIFNSFEGVLRTGRQRPDRDLTSIEGVENNTQQFIHPSPVRRSIALPSRNKIKIIKSRKRQNDVEKRAPDKTLVTSPMGPAVLQDDTSGGWRSGRDGRDGMGRAQSRCHRKSPRRFCWQP